MARRSQAARFTLTVSALTLGLASGVAWAQPSTPPKNTPRAPATAPTPSKNDTGAEKKPTPPTAEIPRQDPPKTGDDASKAGAKGKERAEQAHEHAEQAKTAGLEKATEARGEAPPAYAKLTGPEKVKVRLKKFDLDKTGLAIKGYDPVSYFPEGGSTPVKGDKRFGLVRDGVQYRFASEAHRELFKADPAKYEPAYGGWCAYAMAKGDYTEPDPKRYLIQNGKLMLFYDGFFGDTYKKWNDEGPKELEPKADEFWKGEIVKESEKVAAEKDG